MNCPRCGAVTRSGARFCEQCGTSLQAAAVGAAAGAVTADAHVTMESVVDEMVDTLAQEPGTRKGPVLWIALLFLLLILLAGLWWAFKDGAQAQRDAPLVGSPSTSADDVVRAPTLAEQMGTGVASSTSATDRAPAASSRQGVVPPMPVTREARPRAISTPTRQPAAEERAGQTEAARTDRTAGTDTQREQLPAKENAPALSTAQQVAECEKMSVFARQPCLWRACNHKWGEDGCPSYD